MNITIIVMLPVRNANEKIRDMSGVKDDDDDDCLLFVSVVWTVICSISLNIFFPLWVNHFQFIYCTDLG